MNILFLLQRYPGFGGIESVTKILSKELCDRYGHNITVFATSSQSVPSQIISHPKWFYIHSDLKNERLEEFFLKTVEEREIDIIIYQDSYIPEEFLLQHIDHHKTKIIVCEHNAPDSLIIGYKHAYQEVRIDTPKGVLQKTVRFLRYLAVRNEAKRHHRLMVERADRYYLLSMNYRQALYELFGISSTKIYAMGNPVNMPICKFSETSKKKEILFVGRLSRQKGIFHLMNVWKLVESQLADWKLVIVGDGDLKNYIEDYVVHNNLLNVNIVGFSDNVQEYYSRASIFIMTSIYEGFPMVLYEAMAQACVPIAFNSFASVTDIIDEGSNGLLVDAFNEDEYANKIVNLARNPEYLKKMAISGIEKAKKNAVLEIAAKWNQVFNEISQK